MKRKAQAAIAAFLVPILLVLSMVLPAQADYYKPATLGNITGGPLSVSKGGTGATSTTSAINALLPSQSSSANKFLQTNGTSILWTTIDKSFLNLGNVENTALSTWAGSGNLTTIGTLSSGSVPVGRITGTLPLANGGTGQTSASAAINALVPAQTGNAGKVLGTNGTSISWQAASAAACSGCVETNILDIAGVTADNNSDDEGTILDTWLATHKTKQILHVPPGVYDFSTPVGDSDLSNFKIKCDPGAVFKKKTGFSGSDYLWLFINSSNITVEGCQFEGLTTSTTTYLFGEQGILCASCDGFFVRFNRFLNFGDAAVRASDSTSLAKGLSKNTWIDTNYFGNVFQVTTTPGGDVVVNNEGWGGSDNWHVTNNTFDNLKGSVKYCTRYPVRGGFIHNNRINSSTAVSTSVGVELCSVKSAKVTNNVIIGAQAQGISVYPSTATANGGLNSFNWGDLLIAFNDIIDCARGIRISNDAYPGDGLKSDTSGIRVIGNTIQRPFITSGTTGISWVNGPFRGSLMSLNIVIDKQATANYFTVDAGVLDVNNVQN